MADHYIPSYKATLLAACGPGYIAGESPNGLVLRAGVPEALPVLALHRGSGMVAANTISDATTGEYRMDGLSPDEEFDVICRDTTYVERDKIIGRVKPKPY